jgi:hypothetical protein
VVAQRLIHRAPGPGEVIGVNDAYAALEGHRTLWALQAADAVVLVGPGEQAGGQIPVPTADMCELLRFGQECLAPPQLLLDSLAVGDVAEVNGDAAILRRGGSILVEPPRGRVVA